MKTFGNWCVGILCIILFIVCLAFAIIGCNAVMVHSNVVTLQKTDLIKSGHASYQLDSLTGKTEFVLDSTFLKEK